jgi:hypothetical protein
MPLLLTAARHSNQDSIMKFTLSFRAAALATVTLAAALSSAQAADLAADGSWTEFHVDAEQASTLDWLASYDDNSLAHYTFTITAGNVGSLTVLDTGFSGDRFMIRNHGITLGQETSVGVDGDPSGIAIVDFDLALADPAFSRGVYTLQAGSYDISGFLSKSLTYEVGIDKVITPLNSTTGGIALTVSAVPEPATVASLLAGLALLAMRRKSSSK